MLVLFDLDGTILDSLDAWALAYRKAVHPRELTDEEIVGDFFHASPESLARHGITNVGEFYRLVHLFLEENSHMQTVAIDAEEALGELEKKGHTLGILTARSKKIATVNLPPQLLSKFKIVIDRDDAPPKPRPDGVFKACKDTGIPISETVLVGDHPIDAGCAESAGIPFLLYKPDNHVFRSHRELLHLKSFSSFEELPGIISRFG